MATWYRTCGWRASKIAPVEIERFTDNSVWVGGRRSSRRSGYEQFFPTWEEAHAYLMDEAEGDLRAARSTLQDAQGRYGNIKGMKPPE